MRTLSLAASAVALFINVAGATQPSAIQPSGDSSVLQAVIVTATRRSENLQKAPADITVVDGKTLADRGVYDMTGLQSFVPSAQFNVETNVVQIFVRGVGSQIDSPWIPDSVSTNFNDVNVPRFLTGTTLYDVSRVEVLPGPQGTLYGTSALGGVVDINANLPTQTPELDSQLEIANYGTVHYTGVANMPIDDSLSVRVAVNTNKHDAYFANGTDTENSQAFRGSALYKPSGSLSVLLWGSYYVNDNIPESTIYWPSSNPSHPWNQPQYDSETAFYYPPYGNDRAAVRGHYQSVGGGARIDWQVGGGTLSYIPSYLTYGSQDNRDVSGFYNIVDDQIHQITQELRFTSASTGPFTYVDGLYWYKDETTILSDFGPSLTGFFIPNTSTGYAAYGQGTYSFMSWLRGTAGARYSHDSESAADGSYAIFPTGSPPSFGEGRIPFSADTHWSRLDWKVGLEADVSPRGLVYGNVQTGYEPGGYQSAVPDLGVRLEAQTMLGFTVGSKSRFLNDHLQANDEAYYYGYKNQVLSYNSNGANIDFNVPKSRMYGDELDVIYLIDSASQVNLGLGLLKAQITEFNPGNVNFAGYEEPFAPEASISAGAQHRWDLPSGASLLLRVDTHYEDGYWGIFSHTSGLHQDWFTMTDLSLRYFSQSGKWDVALWGKNLENTAMLEANGETGLPYPNAGAAFINPPRTFGIRFHANFQL